MQGRKKTKICHIEITPKNAMPRVWRAAIAAKEAGYDITVIGEGESTEYEGIRYIGFDIEPSRLKRIFIRSQKMVRAAIEEHPDIVEIHSPEMLLYYRELKKNGIKVLFNSHEFYRYQILEKKYIPLRIRRVIAAIYGLLERYVCQRIDGVIYPCTIEGINYFADIAKSSIKIENYSMNAKEYDYSNVNKIPNSIIYAGSLTEARGITTLVRVANKMDCQLFLCGSFPSKEYHDEIMRIMDPSKVHYMGSLDRNELFELYGKMYVGASLLKRVGQYDKIDNLSTKIYECMSCGLPVVCTNFPYVRETNSKYHYAIAVNPDDENEIQSAFERLFEDRECATELGKNGKKAIECFFSWENEKSKLVDYYKRFVDFD